MNANKALIRQAILALKQQGVRGSLCPVGLRVRHADAQLEYAVQVIDKLTPSTYGAASMQLQHRASATGLPVVLLTHYLTPPMASKLRAQKQQFIDAVGNAYLEAPGLLVFVTGHKPQAGHAAPSAGKAHTLSGLKVMFALLCDPALASASQRVIAQAAGVALGAIGPVLADLQATGYLAVLNKRSQLLASKRLLDEWALAYARRLRGKNLQASYSVQGFDDWKSWAINAPTVLWGGEPAANLLAGYLRPGVLTVYADKLPPSLVVSQKMRLKRNVQASDKVLEWRKPFWGNAAVGVRPDCVHPVLVYADLLATGDARCMETAQLIYDKQLARLLPAA